MTKLLILFSGVTLLNVILSTAKSIVTVKGGKGLASFANAISYGFYTFVVYLVAMDDGINIWLKAGITFLANLIGVYLVKWLEDKIRKDRVWIYEGTINCDENYCKEIKQLLSKSEINLIYTPIKEEKLYDVKIFANSKEESKKIKSLFDLLTNSNYYVIETK